jgi:glycosyltransferase involved in cell wall biosynthesis
MEATAHGVTSTQYHATYRDRHGKRDAGVSAPFRIAVTVDPEIPVPPTLYGGIERIVDMLIHGLVDRGHEVTLFAHPDSGVPCRLRPYPGLRSQDRVDLALNMWYVSSTVLRGEFDLVHSFGRLAYLLPLLPLPLPKIMSYQRTISPRSVAWGDRLSRGSLHVTACSQHILQASGCRRNRHVIYNAAPADRFTFHPDAAPGAPLVFLGRIEPIKGAHLAIEVAHRSDRPLIIAGNVPESAQEYFVREIEPHLDGTDVTYLGPVGDAQKNDLLGGAAAFLMPVLWDEPFGIVMAEALACGTPVIGLNRGAVPEVVQDGVNGFVCCSVEEMAARVGAIQSINRGACREIMEHRFSDRVMVDAYEALYRSIARKSEELAA